MLGHLLLKSIIVFWEWPFPLSRMSDPEETHDSKLAIARQLYQCPSDHLEFGLARHIRQCCPSAEDLPTHRIALNLIDKTIDAAMPTNSQCEDAFARQQKYNLTNFGKTNRHEVLISRHVVREAAVSHEITMSKLPHDVDADVNSKSTRWVKTKQTGWNVFLRKRHLCPRDGAVIWHSMSESEKAVFQAEAMQNTEPPQEEVPSCVDHSRIKSATPYGIGDQTYPISEQRLQDVAGDIVGHSEKFNEMVGGIVTSSDQLESPDTSMLCCTKYPRGICRESLTAEHKATIETLKTFLYLSSKLPVHCEDDLDDHVLLHVIPDDAIDAAPVPTCPEYLVIWLSNMHNPLQAVGLECRVPHAGPLVPGDVVEVAVEISAVRVLKSFAHELSTNSAHWKFLQYRYTCHSIVQLEVSNCEDVTDKLISKESKGEAQEDVDAIVKLMKSMKDKPTKQKNPKQQNEKKKKSNKASGADQEQQNKTAMDKDDDIDENDGVDEYDGSDWESLDKKQIPNYWEVKRSWKIARNETENVDVIQEKSSENIVHFCKADDNERVGRMSLILSSRSYSLYCRLHQCSICIASNKAPSKEIVQSWFQEGLKMGKGKSHKQDHSKKNMFMLHRIMHAVSNLFASITLRYQTMVSNYDLIINWSISSVV
jgi:hypothetical protein